MQLSEKVRNMLPPPIYKVEKNYCVISHGHAGKRSLKHNAQKSLEKDSNCHLKKGQKNNSTTV